MNWITIGIWTFAACFGFYTAYLRITSPHKLAKLQAMKQSLGDTPGTIVHTVAYSVIPIAAGIIFIVVGTQGHSLF